MPRWSSHENTLFISSLYMVKIGKDPGWIKHGEREFLERWVDGEVFWTIPGCCLAWKNCDSSESHLQTEAVVLCCAWCVWKRAVSSAKDWRTSLSRLLNSFLSLKTSEFTNQIVRVHDRVDLSASIFTVKTSANIFPAWWTHLVFFRFPSLLLLMYQQIMTVYGCLASETAELGSQLFNFRSSGWAYRIVIVC